MLNVTATLLAGAPSAVRTVAVTGYFVPDGARRAPVSMIAGAAVHALLAVAVLVSFDRNRSSGDRVVALVRARVREGDVPRRVGRAPGRDGGPSGAGIVASDDERDVDAAAGVPLALATVAVTVQPRPPSSSRRQGRR